MSKTPSANIIDKSLVLSLPNALNPVVWRMELSKAKMSAIEIREDKLGDFTLTLKTPKGDTNEIARFKSRNDALKSLNSITSAMKKAEKKEDRIKKPVDKKMSFFKTIFVGGAATIFLIITVLLVISFIATITGQPLRVAASNGQTSSAGIGAMQDGVPQSADDFLKAQ
jgi:hypothetical protein